MARGKREVPPCCKRYGPPLYCAAWAPVDKIAAAFSSGSEEKEKEEEEVEAEKNGEGGADSGSDGGEEGSEEWRSQWIVVLGGGGGEGRSGVPNALLLSRFDPDSKSLGDEPLHLLGTEKEAPYRMAVHPGGDGVICSFPKSCRLFEWDSPRSKGGRNLTLKFSERMLTQLEDVGQQLALAFNSEGSLLASGGEDGHLRIFRWPSMEAILDKSDAHESVKDMDFSTDGKFLVSLGSSGPCRIWDTTSCSIAASLPRENGEKFGFCRFSQCFDGSPILYITAMQGQYGRIISWDPISWKRIGSKQISRDPICAFNVSMDKKLIAVGTIEGDIIISNSSDLRVQTNVKKAHLGIVTALEFKDSRALLSASFDASARVTLIEDKKKNGIRIWIILFVLLLAALVYYLRENGTL